MLRDGPVGHRTGATRADAAGRLALRFEEVPPVTSAVPFSATEDAIVASERRDWPMNILVEARVRGTVEERSLAAAAQVAVERHPAARRRRAPTRPLDRVQRWITTEQLGLPPVVVGSRIEEVLSEPIDLVTGPPFRLVLVPGDDGTTRLALCAHHGVFDGLGAVNFLREVIASCAGWSPFPGVPAAPVGSDTTPSEPVRRGRRSDAARQALWSRPSARLSTTGVGPGRSRDPAPSPPAAPGRGYGLSYLSFDETWLDRLRMASRKGTTVNDVLVAATHLSVDRWNAMGGRDTGWISVVVPVSLRRSPAERASIENHTGQVTVWSDPRSRRDASLLLRTVSAATAAVRERGADDLNASAFRAAAWLPVGLRMALPSLLSKVTLDRSTATTRLSNLGRIDPAGFDERSLSVDSLWFSPPCRPPQTLVLGAAGFAGRLHLTARWCRPVWDDDGAARYLNVFTGALADVVDAMGADEGGHGPR